ncbi:MAG: transaldolase family protein [Nitrososphaerota archaeon]|nr:transaldolase [Candidatus Bathyarchaeota archaeon]MDW8048116.1 transaldolase family protein [Nitrososphaerota archaeon]
MDDLGEYIGKGEEDLKIFIDTAEIEEIRKAVAWGVIDGATTNPTLIKKAVENRKGKIAVEEYIKEILRTVPGPVSLEVTATRAEEMINQARILYEKFSPYGHVVIKIPINPGLQDEDLDFDGLIAIRELSKMSIPTNCTLIMTPEQAILAAKAGATYASPFAGRIDDYIRKKMGLDFKKEDYFDHETVKAFRMKKVGERLKIFGSPAEALGDKEVRRLIDETQDNGVLGSVDLVAKIVKIYRNYGYKTQVIAASMRNARQVREMAEIGVDVVTLPFYVIRDMVRHYKTFEGMRAFMADVVPQYLEIFKDDT